MSSISVVTLHAIRPVQITQAVRTVLVARVTDLVLAAGVRVGDAIDSEFDVTGDLDTREARVLEAVTRAIRQVAPQTVAAAVVGVVCHTFIAVAVSLLEGCLRFGVRVGEGLRMSQHGRDSDG